MQIGAYYMEHSIISRTVQLDISWRVRIVVLEEAGLTRSDAADCVEEPRIQGAFRPPLEETWSVEEAMARNGVYEVDEGVNVLLDFLSSKTELSSQG